MSAPSDRWFQIQHQSVVVPPHVVFRALAQETVVLNIKTGQYHGVDPVGARFFETMRAGEHLTTVADALAGEYAQPLQRIRDDLAVFVDELVGLGLVELHLASR